MPTIIVFAAIPVSVIGILAIAGFGFLSINVISLAGLAFAVGMVVDASIVSLENIFGYDKKELMLLMPPIMVHGKCGPLF